MENGWRGGKSRREATWGAIAIVLMGDEWWLGLEWWWWKGEEISFEGLDRVGIEYKELVESRITLRSLACAVDGWRFYSWAGNTYCHFSSDLKY